MTKEELIDILDNLRVPYDDKDYTEDYKRVRELLEQYTRENNVMFPQYLFNKFITRQDIQNIWEQFGNKLTYALEHMRYIKNPDAELFCKDEYYRPKNIDGLAINTLISDIIDWLMDEYVDDDAEEE